MLQVNARASQVECAVQGLLLDELELASLRGEVQEALLSLNLEQRLGRAVVSVMGPRFSGLQGQSLSGAFRWERDVVRLERAVLQQANSRCGSTDQRVFSGASLMHPNIFVLSSPLPTPVTSDMKLELPNLKRQREDVTCWSHPGHIGSNGAPQQAAHVQVRGAGRVRHTLHGRAPQVGGGAGAHADGQRAERRPPVWHRPLSRQTGAGAYRSVLGMMARHLSVSGIFGYA